MTKEESELRAAISKHLVAVYLNEEIGNAESPGEHINVVIVEGNQSEGLGIVMSILSTIAAVILIAGRLIKGRVWAVSGTFTLFAVLFIFIGVLFFVMGLLGEYIGRIYMEVRNRPRYVVRGVIRRDPK